jgi:hypothetical protein
MMSQKFAVVASFYKNIYLQQTYLYTFQLPYIFIYLFIVKLKIGTLP